MAHDEEDLLGVCLPQQLIQDRLSLIPELCGVPVAVKAAPGKNDWLFLPGQFPDSVGKLAARIQFLRKL